MELPPLPVRGPAAAFLSLNVVLNYSSSRQGRAARTGFWPWGSV